ncbi:MAG: CBS domain-containing protein [Candidatus Rokubacteria bacterium]|nr:CBS domain-containing protein [Candidatus Rokubacteria bacterium]
MEVSIPDPTAQTIMARDVKSVDPDLSVWSALAIMRQEGIRHILVVKDDRLVGLVSNRDLRTMLDWVGPDRRLHHFAEATVRQIMTPAERLVTVAPETTLKEIARHLLDRKIGGVPVVDGAGKPVGFVTVTDVLRAWLEHGREPLPSNAPDTLTRSPDRRHAYWSHMEFPVLLHRLSEVAERHNDQAFAPALRQCVERMVHGDPQCPLARLLAEDAAKAGVSPTEALAILRERALAAAPPIVSAAFDRLPALAWVVKVVRNDAQAKRDTAYLRGLAACEDLMRTPGSSCHLARFVAPPATGG